LLLLVSKGSGRFYQVQLFCLYNTVLIIVGCFMTWIEPKIFIVAMRGIEMMDGKIVLFLGALGFFAALADVIRKKTRFIWAYGLVGFTVSIIIGVVFFNYYRNLYNGGPGIFICTLGALQLTAAYVNFLFKKTGASSAS